MKSDPDSVVLLLLSSLAAPALVVFGILFIVDKEFVARSGLVLLDLTIALAVWGSWRVLARSVSAPAPAVRRSLRAGPGGRAC